MIHFEDAHIGYRDALVNLKETSLLAGELYVLVGRNGSGKSTLLNTIIGQQPLLSGRLRIENHLIEEMKPEDFSKKIAFVPSQFPHVEYLEVSRYIALGRTPYTNALGRLSIKDEEHVNRAISALEIERLIGKFTNELSDGERQLVAIARALAQETPIILLDEPTAFLDYPNKQSLLHFLKKISREQHKCILLSSHDIDLSIEAQCPFVIIPSTSGEAISLYPPIDKERVLKLAFLQ